MNIFWIGILFIVVTILGIVFDSFLRKTSTSRRDQRSLNIRLNEEYMKLFEDYKKENDIYNDSSAIEHLLYYNVMKNSDGRNL